MTNNPLLQPDDDAPKPIVGRKASEVQPHVERWFGTDPIDASLAASGFTAEEWLNDHIEGFRAAHEARDYKTMGSLGQSIERFIEKRARLNGVISRDEQSVHYTDDRGRNINATRVQERLLGGAAPAFDDGAYYLDDCRDAEAGGGAFDQNQPDSTHASGDREREEAG